MSARIGVVMFAGIAAWLLVSVIPQMIATHMPAYLLGATSVAVIVYATAAVALAMESRNNGGR